MCIASKLPFDRFSKTLTSIEHNDGFVRCGIHHSQVVSVDLITVKGASCHLFFPVFQEWEEIFKRLWNLLGLTLGVEAVYRSAMTSIILNEKRFMKLFISHVILPDLPSVRVRVQKVQSQLDCVRSWLFLIHVARVLWTAKEARDLLWKPPSLYCTFLRFNPHSLTACFAFYSFYRADMMK